MIVTGVSYLQEYLRLLVIRKVGYVMNIKTRRLVCTVLCIAMLFSLMSFVVYADNDRDYSGTDKQTVTDKNGEGRAVDLEIKSKNNTPKKANPDAKFKVKYYVPDNAYGNNIFWNRSNKFTVYKGQKLWCDFTIFDTWVNWYTIPAIDILNVNKNVVTGYYPANSSLVVTPDLWSDYTGYIDIKSSKLKVGTYYLDINAMPCYRDGFWAGNYYEFDIPYERVTFYVKALPRPTKLKATAGKKKVTVSFKKSTGAQKYEIYRSTKKKSGYKKIATTKKTKYVDKKVSKKKKYYYRVRALRGSTKAGVARSTFTPPVRSKKVK